MDFNLMIEVTPLLVKAAWITIDISIRSLFFGFFIACGLVFLQSFQFAPIRWFARGYISVIRGTPYFVQLLLVFYGGPSIGLRLDPITCGVVVGAFNIAAYMSEAIRGSIESVDSGQVEASRSLGFGKVQTLVSIILPQSAALMIRSIGILAIVLIKNSSLVSIISVVELTYQAQRLIGSTYKPLEIFTLSAFMYVIIIYAVMGIIELAYRRAMRYTTL
ncbi:amino acid ABC transporter permease [Marinomonas polaris]|jgi:polar amino acid transport system permease protein|uniref:Amino acid ABC transporter membrane protein 1, PAAT family n=2 Tax=Oceanospirillaceae TaxID=135620 RepID=A0A1M4VSU9_9GAMM|nr:amino acid ABC transporter permease [Marinomonas sp. ef1]PJE55490.1 nickel transporter [Marinomonas sp. BSi20584]SHE72114.1 amino acid ABC transporter membrane protein 1, PAAT family [Marinomonas polaris DSM 16579]|tara:strand:+ start:7863 stop:8519 length:657 start_codon:yes stop_codon:yes gene_type:complete